MSLANIFQPLIDIFGPVLVFLHSIIGGSWGWSIIALTVIVRALLLPLAFNQMHSMQKLQRVAPQLKAIQAKYKHDKQRQRQEIIKFYKANEINPLAPFLPLLAQIPVFIGLFYTLQTRLREDICPGLQAAYRHAYALHHHVPFKEAFGHTTACHGLSGSSWLFIHDLTTTATGLTLVVLIALYIGTQVASSRMLQAPTLDKTQRRMLLLLPLVFVTFIINFPAGLILYWITTNTWTMGQQWVIRRRIGSNVSVAAAPAPSSDDHNDPAAATYADGHRPGRGRGALGRLRGKSKLEKKQPAAVGTRTHARRKTRPPAPPRKRKRLGRRR